MAPLEQLWRNVLLGFLQDIDQLLGHLALVRCEEGVRFSGGIGATGTADTVNVVLRLLRVVVVDDHLDTVDI